MQHTPRPCVHLALGLTFALFAACRSGEAPPPPPPAGPTGAQPVAGPVGRLEWAPAVPELPPEESEELLEDAAEGALVLESGERLSGGVSPSPPAAAAPAAPNRGPSSPEPVADPLAERRLPDGADAPDFGARAAGARPATGRRAGAPVHATTLRVGDDDVLPLRGVEATAWVDGFRARVLLDCVYENDRGQRLEGSFKLRLPEGATPYYLAFGEEALAAGEPWRAAALDRARSSGPEPEAVRADRAGHWRGAREARLVPRARAARAYGETVRADVDPALLEWAGAGVFQARVFPLEPGRAHRVVVGYECDLAAVDGGRELALDFPAEVPALSLELHVLSPGDGGAPPRVAPDAPSTASGDRRTWLYPDTAARGFRVFVPLAEAAALVDGRDGGFFALDAAPALPAQQRGGPPTAVFLLDTSLSSADGGLALWLDLLEAVLEQNRDELRDFAVLCFDVTPRAWRPGATPNVPGAVAELRAEVEALALEGATDLGAALSAAAALDVGPRALFLLSDGAATWGAAGERALVRALGPQAPLYAYTTGRAGTDVRALAALARESGGALFTVDGAGGVAAAATAHRARPFVIEAARVTGGRDVLLRGRPRTLFPGQRLRVVGRGTPRAGDALELDLLRDGRRTTARVPIAAALSTPLAARAYGEVATAQLEELLDQDPEAAALARAFATRFRVPGAACSLLMLESEADYARHGLLDPDELARAAAEEAAPRVAAALARRARAGEDPAEAFLARLAPLDARPEDGGPDTAALRRPLDPELVRALRALPPAAFAPPSEPLEVRAPRAAEAPAAYRAELASGGPGYDAVQAEAARRRAALGDGDALRALSTLVELNPGDGVFARDVAQTLVAWELYGQAYPLYLRVAELRPFEPQSYLALARCAEAAGRADLAVAWYAVALRGGWDVRFGDFTSIAAFDLAHLARRLGRGELQASLTPIATRLAAELAERLDLGPVDLAVAIEWNTDGTDVDLHVLEPGGEHCYYGHRETALGGRLSSDVTEGLGPELYVLPVAAPGETLAWVEYFSGDPARTAVRTRVLATVWQAWGRPEEVVVRRELLLREDDDRAGVVRLSVPR